MLNDIEIHHRVPLARLAGQEILAGKLDAGIDPVALGHANGIVIEIGRKIRAPESEEAGVQTYTVLWGHTVALQAWLGALILTGLFAWMAARQIEFGTPVAAILVLLLGAATIVAWHFLKEPTPAHARPFEVMSALWTLMMYLSLGAIPIILK